MVVVGRRNKIDPHSITIATTTFYPHWFRGETKDQNSVDKIRGDLAIETFENAIDRGYQLIVVDGGSSRDFREKLSRMGISVQDEQERGMSASRRQAFNAAAKLKGVKVICWTEPEKTSVVKDCLPDSILPLLEGEADIAIPKRDDAAFRTYPSYQADYEQKSNELWNNILKTHNLLPQDLEDLDVWFGPRFFRNDPKILKLFVKKYNYQWISSITGKDKKRQREWEQIYNPELWSNATFIPIVAALHQGLRVKSVPVFYRHPQKQTQIELDSQEFRRKRDIQRKNIIINTRLFIRLLEDDINKIKTCKKMKEEIKSWMKNQASDCKGSSSSCNFTV